MEPSRAISLAASLSTEPARLDDRANSPPAVVPFAASFRRRALARAQRLREAASDSHGTLAGRLVVSGFALVAEAARRALGITLYDVQLLAGLILAGRNIAEMRTGEGKRSSPACRRLCIHSRAGECTWRRRTITSRGGTSSFSARYIDCSVVPSAWCMRTCRRRKSGPPMLRHHLRRRPGIWVRLSARSNRLARYAETAAGQPVSHDPAQ